MIEEFGKAQIEDIKAIEKRYNVNFPSEYVTFLEASNGGIVDKSESNQVLIEDLNATINIDVLYGINTGNSASNIETWMGKLKEDMMEGSVIIGDDLMQGMIVMICEGEFEGIYYLDDAFQFEESTDEENTYWIAKDFPSFFRELV
ncbi:SMI1/KNR4 family protein [Listeria booriae]|uniref:SMI1/KNR4 family protein n=1 Tax=Listeria booriae TaxID=1552123 RepID=UPI0016272A26|nr:SMI1/KNR4 family protein [Listeria booriae]MBC1650731.1 SMI1/KNR4 family protein [Listeria booriae]